MQEDTTEHEAQTQSASEQAHWYSRLWACCLGYGCLEYPDVWPYDLNQYVPVAQFQMAASMGDWLLVQDFIHSRGYHVDESDWRNRTSLHYACAANQTYTVKVLIENNSNINVQDDEGCTPLIKAAEMDNPKCVSLLLQHGANPHMADFFGNTALHYAVYNGNQAIARELLEHHVDINGKTKNGFTPFSLAVYRKKDLMAAFLKESGADITEIIESNSEGTSSNQPEPRTETHVSYNEEVHCSTDPKTIRRITDKPDPDVPGPTREDSDSISALEKISEDPEMKTNSSECVSVKPPSTFSHHSKLSRRSIKKRFKNLFGTYSANVCPQKEPLPIPSEGQTPIKQNASPDSAKKILDRESVPPKLPPEDTRGDMLMEQKNTREDRPIKEEATKMVCGLSKNTEDNVLVEEHLPRTAEEETHSTKTHQGQDKTECDRKYTAVHFQLPSEESTEEKWAQLVATQCADLNQYLKERLEERMKEGIENSKSDASEEEPLPSTSGGRTHLRQKTEEKKKHESKDAYFYFSRHYSVERNKDKKEEADRHHAEQKELLRNDIKEILKEQWAVDHARRRALLRDDIKEILKEQLAVDHARRRALLRDDIKEILKEESAIEHSRKRDLFRKEVKEILKEQLTIHEDARMRELFSKVIKEILGPLRHELRQIFMEQVALLLEPVEETLQEPRNQQHLQLKELLRNKLKEMVHEQIKHYQDTICPKETPRPNTSKGTSDLQRTSLEEEMKKDYEGGHDSAPPCSQESLMQTEAEAVGRQRDSYCEPIKEGIKEALCESFESNECDTNLKKELPHIAKGKKQLKKIHEKHKLKKTRDDKSGQSEKPAAKTAQEVEQEDRESQCAHLKETIKKDFKTKICEVIGKHENTVCPKEEIQLHISKEKTRSKKITPEDKIKKKCNVECTYLQPRSSMKRDEATIPKQRELEHELRREHIRKDSKETVRSELENSENIISPEKEPQSDGSRRAINVKKITPEEKIKKKRNVECTSLQSRSSMKRDEATIPEQRELKHELRREHIRKYSKEIVCEQLENSENIISPEKEPPSDGSRRAINVKKITPEEKIKKKRNVKCPRLRPRSSMKRDEATIPEQRELKHELRREYIRKDSKEIVHDQLENSENIISPEKEPPSDGSRRAINVKVEEKSTHLYEPHFRSFQRRLPALRATGHRKIAPAASTGDAGDTDAMDKAQKPELVCPVALNLCTEHERGQPHTDCEPAAGHLTGDTMDPAHSADLALDSCLLAQDNGNRLSTCAESAALCGPQATEDPASDTDLAVDAAHSTDLSRKSMGTSTTLDPAGDTGFTTLHVNDTDLDSGLPAVSI